MTRYEPITQNGFTATPDDDGYVWEIYGADGKFAGQLYAEERDAGYSISAHIAVDGGKPIASHSAYSETLGGAISRVLNGMFPDGWIYAEQCAKDLATIEAWLVHLHKTISGVEKWFTHTYTDYTHEVMRFNRLSDLVREAENSETFREKALRVRVIYDGLVNNLTVEQIQAGYDNVEELL